MLEEKGDSFDGKTVVISGSGNVAQYACEKAIELGAKVVTLSDSSGYIYDINGKHVLKVMDGKKSAGTYSLSWNGLDEAQSLVSSGTYFLLVTAGEFSKVTKIVFPK